MQGEEEENLTLCPTLIQDSVLFHAYPYAPTQDPQICSFLFWVAGT